MHVCFLNPKLSTRFEIAVIFQVFTTERELVFFVCILENKKQFCSIFLSSVFINQTSPKLNSN